jgi:SAM-dependent methyltransferase
LLEIGCGTGFVLGEIRERFQSLEAVATDSLLESLRHAATRLGTGVPLLQVDARDIPYVEDFDVLGAFDVVEHIDEDEAVLKAMFRALRPGGGLLLTVPQHPFLWSAVDDWSRHRRRYTRAELLGKLARAGFQTLRATSFSTLLLPAILLARARPAPAEFDPCFELRIHPALNAVFGGLSSVEHALIRAGYSFRVGGSLFVVARRLPSAPA